MLVDRILRNGDSAEAHLMLGSAKMNIADFAGARDEFAKAVALNPNLPQVHVLYAQALHFTGDSDLSLEEYKAELAIDPYNFEANLQIGATLRQEQKYDEAKQYFARALKTSPGDPAVRYQLAGIALDQGKARRRQARTGIAGQGVAAVHRGPRSLSIAYYRLKRPADGKREREIVQKLTAEAQAKEPGAKAQCDPKDTDSSVCHTNHRSITA